MNCIKGKFSLGCERKAALSILWFGDLRIFPSPFPFPFPPTIADPFFTIQSQTKPFHTKEEDEKKVARTMISRLNPRENGTAMMAMMKAMMI